MTPEEAVGETFEVVDLDRERLTFEEIEAHEEEDLLRGRLEGDHEVTMSGEEFSIKWVKGDLLGPIQA